jgi:hypothetical protein
VKPVEYLEKRKGSMRKAELMSLKLMIEIKILEIFREEKLI